MTGRVRVAGYVDAPIEEGWQVGESDAGSILDPAHVARLDLSWTPVTVPATAASALRAAGRWSLDGPARRFDAPDWWWRVRFPGALAGEASAHDEVVLALDGIATIADVWLNGVHLARTDNMFVRYELPITLEGENELVIACRSVDAQLAMKRPRPRWKAPMIEHAQMRWIRATLLGRTPGWSPPAAAVGPWRPIRLVRRRALVIEDVGLRAHASGRDGVVEVRGRVRRLGPGDPTTLTLELERGGDVHRATARVSADSFEARLVVPDAARWWPHTHGEPALYRARLVGSAEVDLGAVGFRMLSVDTEGGGFTLRVNDARIFCRGACWTPLDPVSLSASAAELDAAFTQIVDAGMNMVRTSGTMTYESDAFFDAADRAGVLVWQDLMFANMDYPEDDASFHASVVREVREQLLRLQGRPSVAVICGNSEGEQQAAMWGATRDRWSPKIFHSTFAELSRELLPDVPYWPSSAHGGAFPHQADRGTTSYYGVGAYERPLEDARRAEVRFASECLAFGNISAPATMARIPRGEGLKVHHPTWKERTPRDLGAGWDFDDVRDHYVRRLFGVDPAALRHADHERYVALGRAVTGEVMANVFGEWRRARSTCAGGLVWFLRDLWPGAGWGIVGADGEPKAAYHYLRRALSPTALHISDEGTNGIVVHAVNDTASAVHGELELTLFLGDAVVGAGKGAIEIPARGAVELPFLSVFDFFLDANHAYRFGPPTADLAHARLESGTTFCETFAFPLGLPSSQANDVGLTAAVRPEDDGGLVLDLATRSFAQSIALEIPGYVPSDDFFHLAPGASRTIRLRPAPARKTAKRGYVTPLNCLTATEVVLPP